jgi:hypothetical protein
MCFIGSLSSHAERFCVQVFLSDDGASWAKVDSGTFQDTAALKSFTLTTAQNAMGFRIVARTEAGAICAICSFWCSCGIGNVHMIGLRIPLELRIQVMQIALQCRQSMVYVVMFMRQASGVCAVHVA